MKSCYPELRYKPKYKQGCLTEWVTNWKHIKLEHILHRNIFYHTKSITFILDDIRKTKNMLLCKWIDKWVTEGPLVLKIAYCEICGFIHWFPYILKEFQNHSFCTGSVSRFIAIMNKNYTGSNLDQVLCYKWFITRLPDSVPSGQDKTELET